MITGTQKLELEKQFKAGLAAIFNKINSNEMLTTDYEKGMEIDLGYADSGKTAVRLRYDYASAVEETRKSKAEKFASLIGVSKEDAYAIMDPLSGFMEIPSAGIIDKYLTHKARTNKGDFGLKIDYIDGSAGHGEELALVNQASVFFEAPSIEKMVENFNAMLADFGLLEKYKITMPPAQDHGRGRRGS